MTEKEMISILDKYGEHIIRDDGTGFDIGIYISPTDYRAGMTINSDGAFYWVYGDTKKQAYTKMLDRIKRDMRRECL